MNDVRMLFEDLVADAPPDPLDLDRVIARGTRRREVRRTVTAGAGLAVALVVGTGIAFVATSDEGRTAPPFTEPRTQPTVIDLSARPSMDVTCESNGIDISPETVIAQPAGVVMRVSSTMPPGSTVSYSYEPPFATTGAHRLPAREGTWTLPLAPGQVTLACEPRGGTRNEILFTVTDPDGRWRGDAVEGCDPGEAIAWGPALTGTGQTPEDAVEATLDGLRAGEAADYTAQPTETGYPEGSLQSWIVRKDGEPYATVAVVDQGSHGYVAVPDDLCG